MDVVVYNKIQQEADRLARLIEQGGGGGDQNPVAPEDDVIFIDYDGIIRYSYSADEFLTLTALPPNPVHTGLTALGWNWTLADAKEYVGDYGALTIGQHYESADGATHLFITLWSEGYLSPSVSFSQTVSNGTTIDWGDASQTETYAGTDIVATHIYSKAGSYEIKLYTSNGNAYTLKTYCLGGGNDNYYNKTCLNEVWPGTGAVIFSHSTFKNTPIKKIATRPNDETTLSTFSGTNLQAFVGKVSTASSSTPGAFKYAITKGYGPQGSGSINGDNLERLELVGAYFYLYMANKLKRIIIPKTISTIGYNTFTTIPMLAVLVLPESITTIGNNNLRNGSYMDYVLFRSSTPPTIEGSNTFQNLASTCSIVVPLNSLGDYLIETNYPSPSTYLYLGWYKGTPGETLPATAGQGAYSLTWYASIIDAKNETNPITTMQGKEVFCRYVAI